MARLRIRAGLACITFQPGAVRYTSQLSTTATSTVTHNLISDDTYGEGIRIIDFKLAKNIRFAGKRATSVPTSTTCSIQTRRSAIARASRVASAALDPQSSPRAHRVDTSPVRQ
jgi:hypothetical protein